MCKKSAVSFWGLPKKFIYPFKYKTILNFHYQNLIDLTNSSTYDNERVQQLKNNISPFFIRIRKSDLNLPPVKDQLIQVEMGKNQKFIYYPRPSFFNRCGKAKKVLTPFF